MLKNLNQIYKIPMAVQSRGTYFIQNVANYDFIVERPSWISIIFEAFNSNKMNFLGVGSDTPICVIKVVPK
ncbi:hypothetical protein C3731_18285 [Brucella oryzae]|uniref:Uncharacterized protein n=1 Tax=Brucella oryzae TaxID=335286 RepID=A0A2S7IVE7_9HYPH|nr:hypothetical protein C3731_18285 [Brucella oryzae]